MELDNGGLVTSGALIKPEVMGCVTCADSLEKRQADLLAEAGLTKEAANAIAFAEEELIKNMDTAINGIYDYQPGRSKEDLLKKTRDRDLELIEKGREQAASMYPIAHDEGFKEGWQACLNALFHKLRKRAAIDPASKELLIELLDGS